MPIATSVLRAHVIDDTNDQITVYLNTGNPGSAGTANRVPSGSLGSATIPANGWTVHATNATASVSSDINFGTASAAVNGVAYYSMFKGSALYATRAIVGGSVNFASGTEVVLTGSTVTVEYTSTDS